MRSHSESERALRSVLDVLSDYAGELILIGGWVPFLHLAYGRAAVQSPRTSRTTEVDLLLPSDMRRDMRRPIAEILREADFDQRGPGGVTWVRRPADQGDVIEFMQPLTGPARDRGAPGAVADQPALRALRLDHLRVMEDFTEMVLLPPNEEVGPFEIRVPALGAFVLNKANTFHSRGGKDAEVKAGKDLLYLRDIMAAGDRPAAVLERDLDAIASHPKHAATIRRGAYHMAEVARRYFDATAEILAERDGMDIVAARADVEGYLTDLADVLSGSSESGP